MSPPWMPFYVADYLADTAHLGAAEHGAYLLLIMHYWRTGALPDDDKQLSRITCMTPAEWKRTRSTVQAFFHDGWQHHRIDEELAKANAKQERRQEAGKRGGIAKAAGKQKASNATNLLEQTDSNALASSSQPQPEKKDSSLREEHARERASPSGFDRFWDVFPNKVGKHDARKSFERITKAGKTDLETLMAGLLRYAAKTDDRPWCNPATWLNQGRWDDQPATAPPRAGPSSPRPGSREDRQERMANVLNAIDPRTRREADDGGPGEGADPSLVRLISAGQRH